MGATKRPGTWGKSQRLKRLPFWNSEDAQGRVVLLHQNIMVLQIPGFPETLW